MKRAILALLIAATPSSAFAQAAAPACGFDCSRPGRLVLCNDSLQVNSPGQNVDCSASLGSCTGEAFCGSFRLANNTTVHLRNVYVLTGPSQAMAEQFDLEVYNENFQAQPGARIAPLAANSYGLVGNPTQFQQINLAMLGNAYEISNSFRVCLRKQFDGSHNVCLDANGAQANANWMYAGFAVNCQTIVTPAWTAASTFGLNNDFAIRPEIEVTDLSPWMPGGVCTTPQDAGVADAAPDSGAPNPDATPPDAPAPDAGFAPDAAPQDAADLDAAPPQDAADLDAAPPQDAEPIDGAPTPDADPIDAELSPDATAPPEDAGAGDAALLPPPVLTAISPSSAANDRATDVVVSGSGFVSGLTLRIGPIPAASISVPGPTTINAVVPSSIAPGSYDVVVQNPDGQASILARGFTVTGAGGSDPAPDEGCGCTTQKKSGDARALIALFVLLAFARARAAQRSPARSDQSARSRRS